MRKISKYNRHPDYQIRHSDYQIRHPEFISGSHFISTFLLIVIFLCLTGCNLRAEQKSLTKQFEIIDALIMQNQLSSAVKELKKTESKAFDSWSYIGIYKRYAKLGEKNHAERVIKKAIKNNKDNIELLAIYTNFLLRENKIDTAKKMAVKLRGTKFASLYSELILRQSYEDLKSEKTNSFWQDEQFYQIYADAYNTSKNSLWARNCAVYDLTHGLYENAARNVPSAFSDVDDAYFWALVYYDAGRFYECIETLDLSQKLLNDYTDYNNKNIFKTTQIQQVSLKSDAYMAVSDMESAENERQMIVMNVDNITPTVKDDDLLSTIFLNSAIWSENQGLQDRSVDLLFYLVQRWPENVPAIILYADYAYKINLEREEDTQMKALRREGIKTIEMEKYDNRRKIPMSDALYRIDEGIKRTNDPYLNIAKLDLKYKTDRTLQDKDKYRDLWRLLEDNYVEGEKYKLLLVQYALNFLINTKEYNDAWNLFRNYVMETGKWDEKRNFWEQFIEQLHLYDLKIVEFASWFACYDKLLTEATRLCEYCVYESNGMKETGFISQGVSTATCMNLADLYFSIGKSDLALDLYGKTAGRESKNSLRSEIFYRIACIYASQSEIKKALRSAEYAISLYPHNARASLLKDKLNLRSNTIQ